MLWFGFSLEFAEQNFFPSHTMGGRGGGSMVGSKEEHTPGYREIMSMLKF